MDRQMIVAPVVADRETLQDFIDSLRDYAPGIEGDIAHLRSTPADRGAIGSLFRALHSIKGDATICRLDLAVAIVHPVESVLDRVRQGELPFSEQIAEVILLTIDRLELAMAGLSAGDRLDGLHLVSLVEGLERLASAPTGQFEDCVAEVIEAVTGFRPVSAAAVSTRREAPGLRSTANSPTDDDLRFFHTLADQFEARSPIFKGRTLRLLRLALETNRLAGETVDPLQLEAAVYMHDIGMMFLPESAWLKTSALTAEEKAMLRTHPAYAAGLLARMSGWAGAAEMVAQHHETPDGKGYPAAHKAAQICPGAKLLAIVDAYEAVMLKHGSHGRTRSLLRAIAEINACDTQFAPEWIEPFNRVIRRAADGR